MTEIEVINLRMDPIKWLLVETEFQVISWGKGIKAILKKKLVQKFLLCNAHYITLY